ncbi:hypothetical protein Scep_010358 [Stephania cephalantha]|uniref:Uncharacterized protein n=1 Tax=Stephania cephalantha TaxID=152367 RepID=A0AAP0PE13_9MAGN
MRKSCLCNQIYDSEETVSAATSKSVESNEFSIVYEYLSEPEETLEVSSQELDITIAQSTYDEVEKSFQKGQRSRIKRTKKTNLWYLFVLKVPNELPILKEGVHVALPEAIDAPFVDDVSKGEGIT